LLIDSLCVCKLMIVRTKTTHLGFVESNILSDKEKTSAVDFKQSLISASKILAIVQLESKQSKAVLDDRRHNRPIP